MDRVTGKIIAFYIWDEIFYHGNCTIMLGNYTNEWFKQLAYKILKELGHCTEDLKLVFRERE